MRPQPTPIKRLMETLKISEAEARDILRADEAIDKGEKLFEFSKEQKKVEKKMRSAGRAPNYQFKKVERKPNEDKRFLIQVLENSLKEVENVKIVNPERQIEFTFNGTNYRIVLSAPRK